MKDLARLFPENPILSPSDLTPSSSGPQIACLLNPGVFKFDGKIWLLVGVAERPEQTKIRRLGICREESRIYYHQIKY